jgi:two-component system response regulator AtoC
MADIKPVILVVDDETNIRESFSLILEKEFKVVTASSGEAALKRIIDEKVDLVYLDIRMPGMNGMETLKRIKEIDNNIEVIMVTALNDVGGAASAIKLGAKDYIVKPFDVKDILNRTRSFVIKAQTKAIRTSAGEELIGNSRQIQNIRRIVEQLSQKGSSVLIIGEKGLEAEQIAAIINGESEKELKKLNASSDLGSSVLFGREKGSFTSEFGKEAGMLEEANGGILFIRNIELLNIDIQKKLGQGLSKKEFSRDGSPAAVHADVRVIAETSANLAELVKEGSFDRELYNAISKTVIELPPLRMRESDIPILINYYIDKFSIKYDRKLKVSPEALEILAGYTWPGNLAELSNVVEAIMLSIGKETLEPDDLPLDILIKSPAGGRPYTTLENIEGKFEKAHILNVYKKAGESKEKASAMLGIGLKTLESKLESINA